jgi:hypothetical protein
MTDDLKPAQTYCPGCGKEIDPETCHCGNPIDHSPWEEGHMPVPMGCECGYRKPDQPSQADGGWCVIKGEPEDSYPCLLWHQDWIDPDFNPTGVRQGFWGPHPDDPDQECWIVARWNPCHDVWETERAEPQPSHWRPMPAPPTDQPAPEGERD